VVLEDLVFDTPKTKNLLGFLEAFGLTDALVVLPDPSNNVALSARNLQEVTLLPPAGVNVYDVLKRSRLVMSRAAVEAVTARLGGEA
jgi:large subunit ribosomal protein L4